MGFSVRSLVLPALFALVVVPAVPTVASAQGAGATPGTPPPPGGGAPATATAAGATGSTAAGNNGAAVDAAAVEKKGNGQMGGYAYDDKPSRRAAPVGRAAPRRAGGPQATFPGFEQLPDGGSRLFVQLSHTVPVEERRAQGSVTYVLKGAHLRVNNDANALVTVHFNTPVFRARLMPSGNDLLFVLEMRSAASPTFKVHDNQDKTSTLQIDFAKGDFLTGNETLPAEVRPQARGATTGARRGARGATAAPQTGRTTPAPAQAPAAASPDPGPTP